MDATITFRSTIVSCYVHAMCTEMYPLHYAIILLPSLHTSFQLTDHASDIPGLRKTLYY